MRKFTVVLLLILFLLPILGLARQTTVPVRKKTATVEEQFKKSFPKNNYESITPTAVSGVYEVYAVNELYYYIPKDEVILYGSLITKNGVNLTRESFLKKMAQKIAKLPLASAIKIGNGKTVIVEFVDPNCHFCRESYKYFAKHKDLTMYAFLYPLSKESADKAKYILCSKDAVKAYNDVLSGKLDKMKPDVCPDKKADETIKTNMKFASQIGLRGTPLFYIKGQVVDGFDPPALDKLLKN
ncbi:MAG TPA: DsbC family protein [Smithella sp.]|nr:DsbC family protein [Smithella sp.]MDM7986493.1 DsbC family protein [Smithella sp.]HNY50476.1 DsbC family protein [Smithella sp.]HOG90196.1 DsbC family protein [Smithella sp.]HOU50782.1 DsbC family protein [Smithella sp.]